MVKISYVLPCYNVERFIADCLNSIYAQDLPEADFEVICVDDCSSDGTCKSIEEWQSVYPNLQLIRHPKNMHVGIARNTGVKHAIGKYVCFVDADDYLPGKIMKKIASAAIDEDVDVLLYNNVVDVKGEYITERIMYPDSCVMSGGDFVENCLSGDIGKLGSPWAKLFNRSFLLQHSIWYSDLVYSEDAAFVWEVIICAKKVKSISDIGYVYRANDTSFSADIKKPFVLYTSSILYPEVLITILNKYGNAVPGVILWGIVNEIRTEINGFFGKYLSYGEEGRREIYSMIRHTTAPIWKLYEYMNRKQRMAFLSRKMGYGIFEAVVKKLYNN